MIKQLTKKLKLGRVYFDLKVRVTVHHGEEGMPAWCEVAGHTAHSQKAKVEQKMKPGCEISLPNHSDLLPSVRHHLLEPSKIAPAAGNQVLKHKPVGPFHI